MTHTRPLLLGALALCAVVFIWTWFRVWRERKRNHAAAPSEPQCTLTTSGLVTGFVTDFLDTLGIGSFATTTSIFKFARMVPDELIPGTMNVGHTLPTILEAFLYIGLIEVDFKTLVFLIAASVAGAWSGAGIVARLPRRGIQLGMATALAASVVFLLMAQMHWFPSGGQKLSLAGTALIIGMVGTFIIGALGTLGIGFYAPCMILLNLLGIAPLAAFPIMMGSSAFLLPAASARFLKRRFYEPQAALGLTLSGVLGVLLAAFVVKSLPLGALRWLVVGIAGWASLLLFRASRSRTIGTEL